MNKTELKAAAARLLYNSNRSASDYDMLIRFIDSHFDDQTERSAEPEEVRLIDANRMKIVLEKNFGGTGVASYFAQLIDMQPTAYDLKAVLAELNDNTKWLEFMIYPLDHRERLILDRAEEIVKRGGRNEGE